MKNKETFLEYIKSRYSSTSANTHYNNALRYLTYIGEKALTANGQDVLNYIEILRMQGLHPKTLRNYLFGVKIYYNYLQQSGQRQNHPCKKLYLKDKINRAIPMETLYSEKQLEELMNEYRCLEKREQQRNLIIISLLIYQALSMSEIRNLRIEDVDIEKGEIYIRGSVQLKARTLPLKPNQIMLFYNYINDYRKTVLTQFECNTESFIINRYGRGLTNCFIRYMLRNRIAPKGKFTAIKIRQSVIANLLKKNDVRVVQVFAGHKRSSTTETYKQTGIEELKDDIRKLHPLK